MRRPALLLLDEPAAGLRHQEKQALADVLRQLRGEGMSILLVEHDMDFVMGLTDRLVVMEFGTKLAEGTPAECRPSPAVRAAYLGRSMMHERASAATDLLLDVRDLHAGYGKAEVLHGLTLARRAGSIVTVIGPNGAGKSTLLNALMGLLPRAGAIVYRRPTRSADMPLEQRVMRGMALVPEKRELFATMTVEDNLAARRLPPVRRGEHGRRRGDRRASTRCSRGCRSGARSWPARCRAASGRCWRWAAR